MGIKINKMSHRKFEAPRHSHLGYLPKRRTKHNKGKIRHFPKDDASKPVHLTAFMGYKAGMTHVVRYMEKREGKKIIKRFGISRLPRKTRRGLRKVACIGAWHPSAVKWTVARTGNLGYYHRTHINNKIYRVGQGAVRGITNNASTEADAHTKNITPIGGFPHYGIVNEDFLLIKGGICGPRKRQVTIRKSLLPQPGSFANLKLEVKFIDPSSKIGHGKF